MIEPTEARVGYVPQAERGSRMGPYAWWQLRDYLMDKGIATVVVLLFAGSLQFMGLKAGLSGQALPPDAARSLVVEAFSSLVGMLVLLGVLFATNGIVSEDRKLGYYRFLFAKPVGVPQFYAQKFAVNGIGFLLVALLLVLIFHVAASQMLLGGAWELVLPKALFPMLALLFLGLGGIGFLMSAVWRVDWLTFMTIYIVSTTLWQLFEEDAGWRGDAVRALPPLHRLSGIYAAVVRERPLPTDDVRWIVLYGLACFVIGLIVLRRRELSA